MKPDPFFRKMARLACEQNVPIRAPVETVDGSSWPRYESGRVVVGTRWDPTEGWEWYVAARIKAIAQYNEAAEEVVEQVKRGESLGTAVLDAIESHPNRRHAELLADMLP